MAPSREARATSTAPPKASALRRCFPGTGLGEPKMGLTPPRDVHGHALCPHTHSHTPSTCRSRSHPCAHRQAPTCLAPAGILSCTPAAHAMHPQPPCAYPDTSVHPQCPVQTPHHGHTHPHSLHIPCYAHLSPCAHSLHAPYIYSLPCTLTPHTPHTMHTLSIPHAHLPMPCALTPHPAYLPYAPTTLSPHCPHSPTLHTLALHPMHTHPTASAYSHQAVHSHPTLHACSPSPLTLSPYSTHTHPAMHTHPMSCTLAPYLVDTQPHHAHSAMPYVH